LFHRSPPTKQGVPSYRVWLFCTPETPNYIFFSKAAARLSSAVSQVCRGNVFDRTAVATAPPRNETIFLAFPWACDYQPAETNPS
jgi:hypothetical protein